MQVSAVHFSLAGAKATSACFCTSEVRRCNVVQLMGIHEQFCCQNMGPWVIQLDLMVELALRHFLLVLVAADAGRNARSAAHVALAKAARQTEEASSVLSEHICKTDPCSTRAGPEQMGYFFPRCRLQQLLAVLQKGPMHAFIAIILQPGRHRSHRIPGKSDQTVERGRWV